MGNEFKTIKELEATYHKDNRFNSIYERGLIALGKIQALKDVLGLIDEGCKRRFFIRRTTSGFIDDNARKALVMCGKNLSHKLCPQCEELKKRING